MQFIGTKHGSIEGVQTRLRWLGLGGLGGPFALHRIPIQGRCLKIPQIAQEVNLTKGTETELGYDAGLGVH